MGIGLESSSHKYGLFYETCTRYELITAIGDVITCSKVVKKLHYTEYYNIFNVFIWLIQTENADIFECIPFSHGTLGFLTAVDIKLIPAKKYILQIKHFIRQTK